MSVHRLLDGPRAPTAVGCKRCRELRDERDTAQQERDAARRAAKEFQDLLVEKYEQALQERDQARAELAQQRVASQARR